MAGMDMDWREGLGRKDSRVKVEGGGRRGRRNGISYLTKIASCFRLTMRADEVDTSSWTEEEMEAWQANS